MTALTGCCGGPNWNAEEEARFSAGARRHDHARSQLRAGNFQFASVEYVELWRESTRPEAPVGTYFHGNLTEDISNLVRDYPPARNLFEAMREPMESRVLAGAATLGEEDLWIEFTQMIGADEGLVAYAERFKHDAIRMDRLAYGPRRAFDRLIAVERWDLAGWVYTDPVRVAGGREGFMPNCSEPGPVLRAVLDVVEYPLVAIAPVTHMPRSYDVTAQDSPERRAFFKRHEEEMLTRAARIAVACREAGRQRESATIRRTIDKAVGSARAHESINHAEQSAAEARQKFRAPQNLH